MRRSYLLQLYSLQSPVSKLRHFEWARSSVNRMKYPVPQIRDHSLHSPDQDFFTMTRYQKSEKEINLPKVSSLRLSSLTSSPLSTFLFHLFLYFYYSFLRSSSFKPPMQIVFPRRRKSSLIWNKRKKKRTEGRKEKKEKRKERRKKKKGKKRRKLKEIRKTLFSNAGEKINVFVWWN